MAETLMRLESFPFDSRFDGYDDYGYPVFDRAVGARMLRETFKEFFKNGVFPTPANALEISKGNGLSVNLKGGAFIINGAMAVIADGTNIVLADQPPRGIVTYGIMLRFDENTEFRSCYVRVAVGEAGGVIPAPQESAGVKEYRLGYITVPNGAQDVSGATIKNEKGTEFCPYASPFENIDLSGVVNDAKNTAGAALSEYLKFVEKYYSLIESALDGTTADRLQGEIDAVKEQAIGIDLLDADYLAMQDLSGYGKEELGIVEGAIGARELKSNSVGTKNIVNSSVTPPKLSDEIKDLLGLLNTSSWDADRYLSYMNSLETQMQKEAFIDNNVTQSVFGKWTSNQQLAFINASPESRKQTLVDLFDFDASSWVDTLNFAKGVNSTMLGKWIGKTKNVSCGKYGNVPFVIIGIDHDEKVGGGTAKLTIESKKLLWATNVLNNTTVTYQDYRNTLLYSTCATFYNNELDKTVKSLCSKVKKKCLDSTGDAIEIIELDAFPVSFSEYTGKRPSFGGTYEEMMDGKRYQYYTQNGAAGYEAVIRPDASPGQKDNFYYWTRTSTQRDEDAGDWCYYNTKSGSTPGSFSYMDPTHGTTSPNIQYHKYVRPAICLG